MTTDEFIIRYVRQPRPVQMETTEMATKVKLKRGQEKKFKKGSTTGTKYPWDEWFNGDLLQIERSVGPENEKGTVEAPTVAKDYGVPSDSMPPKIKRAARHRYKVCEIDRYDTDGTKLTNAFQIQARDMTADERVAEDILRAEEKAAAKAGKANDADVPDQGDDEPVAEAA